MTEVAARSSAETDLARSYVFAGRYKIRCLLGEGHRKRIYLAEDKLLGRVVALAVVKPAAAKADPEGTGREVKALVQAGNHECIVTLYDRGSAEGADYLVFEYLCGGTLRDYLAKRAKRGNPMPVEDVMRLGRQLARALSHVHDQGLIHRDVTPSNVWLDERRVAHLGDFDSAIRLADPQVPSGLPLTSGAYSAPEELAGQQIDERSDLYSLGAVLFEALTGQQAPRLPDAGFAKRLAALRPDVPHRLSTTICRLLAQSPKDRPSRADEVLHALEKTRSNTSSDLLSWAETLPFPLASILWHFDGEQEPATKIDYLLKFFEALAQSVATVQLSAYMSDMAFFDAHKVAWFSGGTDGSKPIDLRRASFGAWVELAGRLSATGCELLGNDDGTSHYLQLFGTSDPALPEVLVSQDLMRILLNARDRRNEWGGHGGMPGPQIYRKRLQELTGLLSKTQRLLGWSFETWTLLKPLGMTYSHGVFDITAAILKGTNPTFRKKQFRLTQPLDATRLYLLNDGSTAAMQLVPLVRIIAGSKTGEDACYFYDRLEGGEVRWVSYHFRADPELVLPDEDVTELVTKLLRSEE